MAQDYIWLTFKETLEKFGCVPERGRPKHKSREGLIYFRQPWIDEKILFVTLTRYPIPIPLRQKILERDNYRCQYCGALVKGKGEAHLDHIKEARNGGLSTEDNLLVSCALCNLQRGKDREYPKNPTRFQLLEKAKFECEQCGNSPKNNIAFQINYRKNYNDMSYYKRRKYGKFIILCEHCSYTPLNELPRINNGKVRHRVWARNKIYNEINN